MAKSQGVLSGLLLFFGALLALSGLVFTLQGLGIVGPSSSFMFRSSTWIYEGIGILAVGIVVLVVGAMLRPRAKGQVQVEPSSSSPVGTGPDQKVGQSPKEEGT